MMSFDCSKDGCLYQACREIKDYKLNITIQAMSVTAYAWTLEDAVAWWAEIEKDDYEDEYALASSGRLKTLSEAKEWLHQKLLSLISDGLEECEMLKDWVEGKE